MSQATAVAQEQRTVKSSGPAQWRGAKLRSTLMTIAVGLGIWFSPVPEGLSEQVWHLFAIFVATLVAIIAKPVPVGAVTIFAIATCTITKTLTIQQALSSYSSKIVWLVLAAFLLARGFIKTGLGSRISYCFVALWGKSTLGLSYGLVAAELLLAPFIPSNAARGGGVMYPIVSALNHGYDSKPDDDSRTKIGAYLIGVMFQANLICSAMFLTAMAANPLIVSLASQAEIEISWTTWALAASVPGVISLIIMPLVMLKLSPPDIRRTPEAKDFARQQLASLGALNTNEIVMLFTFILVIVLWIFGKSFGIDTATAALLGLSCLLFSGVLSWEDVINEKTAWSTFIWLGALLMLASQLTELGMMSWFSDRLQNSVSNFDWVATLAVVGLVYLYSHYFFASMTAHVTSLYSALLLVLLAAGAPPLLSALVLAFVSNLCGNLTHYSTGSAPVYFGAGYVSVQEWWLNSAIMSVFYVLIWGGIGMTWWKLIGLW